MKEDRPEQKVHTILLHLRKLINSDKWQLVAAWGQGWRKREVLLRGTKKLPGAMSK